MDKKEKVLKGLEICKEDSKLCFGESECVYQSYFPRCWITLAADALALLKEQEPIAPIQGADDQDEDIFCCGSCGAVVGETFLGPPGECEVRDNYCPECGKKVKWE